MRLPAAAVTTLLLLTAGGRARAAEHAELLDAVAVDLRAGRPLVVQVHVPLCDNGLIRCGGHGLGDGDDPARNLYWATSGGFRGWFGRKGSPWRQVALVPGKPSGAIVETRVWRRQVAPSAAFRTRGVTAPFFVYVVATAWRGAAIDDAVRAFVDDVGERAPRELELPDGTQLHAGGRAHIVAFVGHNRWMDTPGPAWPEAAPRTRGVIALACATAPYLAGVLDVPGRVPLLLTADLLFAGAHAFEGAVSAFAEGGSLADIRRRTVQQYAEGQNRPAARVAGAFTNPSDARWPRWRDAR